MTRENAKELVEAVAACLEVKMHGHTYKVQAAPDDGNDKYGEGVYGAVELAMNRCMNSIRSY